MIERTRSGRRCRVGKDYYMLILAQIDVEDRWIMRSEAVEAFDRLGIEAKGW